MTMIVDAHPRTGAHGAPGALIAREAALGSPATTAPGRVLSDVPLGSGHLRNLDQLVPVLSYSWFRDDVYRQARTWLDAVLAAARAEDRPSHTPTQQVVRWVVAIVDLHHRDRAERAAHIIPGEQIPHRRDQIPQQRQQGAREYLLRLDSLAWSQDAPLEATNRLCALLPGGMPDEWVLAKYEERTAILDPIIYARYGDWYVKVAEWD